MHKIVLQRAHNVSADSRYDEAFGFVECFGRIRVAFVVKSRDRDRDEVGQGESR